VSEQILLPMTPEVSAAWIGAAAVAISLVVSIYTTRWVRKQETASARVATTAQTAIADLATKTQLAISAKSGDTDLFVAAFDHLRKSSQERAVGLAALRLLEQTTGLRWTDYRSSVGQLLHTQLVFVLTRGRNRWEAHEVENMINMASWLATDGDHLGLGPDRRRRLEQAMHSYVDGWRAGARHEEDEVDPQAVEALITVIERDWLPPS
jgi:hypothetical protein